MNEAKARKVLPVDPDLRETILGAAETVFAEVGLYDATVEQIARRAGIAKGTIYLYFASKEDLIRAVARAAFDDLGARCRVAVGGRRSRSETLHALIEAHARFFAERPDRLRILHQVRGMLKFSRPEWRGLRRALDEHLGALCIALSTGRRAPEQQADLARLLFGAVSGAASVWAATSGGGRGDSGAALPAAAVSALAVATAAFRGGRSSRTAARARRPRRRAATERRR